MSYDLIHASELPDRQATPMNPYLAAREAALGQRGASVVDIAFRRQRREAEKAAKKAAKEAENAAKPPKVNVQKRFADALLSDPSYAAELANEQCNAMVRRWNGTYWDIVSQDRGEMIAADWLNTNAPGDASNTNSHSAWAFFGKRLAMSRTLPARTRQSIVPVQNAYLVLTDDGVIDVHAPDPHFGLTYAATVKVSTPHGARHTPQPVPEDSLFGRYLATSLPDPEIRAVVQEICGMTLLSKNYHMASWWYSVGRSGKGVMTKLVSLFHAKICTLNLHMLNDPHHTSVMLGTSLVVVNEVDEDKPWCESQWKQIVAGDAIHVNPKNKDPVTYCNSAMLLMSSNGPPFITDTSGAVWARLMVIEWPGPIPEENRIENLVEKIYEAEGHIVLDWLLAGAQRIVKRGRPLTEAERPQAVQKTKRELRNGDCIAGWAFETGVQICDGAGATKRQAYESYRAYALDAQTKVLEEASFWRQLKRSAAFRKVHDVLKRSYGKQVRHVNLHIPPARPCGLEDANVDEFFRLPGKSP